MPAKTTSSRFSPVTLFKKMFGSPAKETRVALPLERPRSHSSQPTPSESKPLGIAKTIELTVVHERPLEKASMTITSSAHNSDPVLRRESIEALANKLWKADGCPEGRALEHWLLAERQAGNLPLGARLEKDEPAQ